MSAPTPVAEGTLATTPFAHLLMALQQRKLTGTLAVWPDDDRPGQDRILVRSGVLIAGRFLEPSETLERSLLPLFRRTRAPYAFYDADLVGEGPGVLGGAVETLALIAAGLRGGGRDEVVDQVLAGYGIEAVRIAAGVDPAMFRLVPKELAIVELLRAAPATVQTLIETSGDEKVARRVLYLLAISGGLDRASAVAAPDADELPFLDDHPATATATAAPAEPPRSDQSIPTSAGTTQASRSATERVRKRGLNAPEPPPPPPASLSDDHRARWEEIASRAAAIDEQNYFQVLGIDESATPQQVRDAYFALVKRLHPDRIPPELEAVRPFAERLFQLVTEAKETLEDSDKRLKYVSAVRGGGGTPAADRKMMIIVQAAHELEKANVLANMGKWPEVLHLLDDVKALDPTQTDAFALEAWALFNLLGQHPAATPETIVSLCDRVLGEAKDGYHERSLYVKGLALKKLGQDEAAMALFRRIAEKNPRHLEAGREVRLYEMRNRGAAKPAEKPAAAGSAEGGLFAKLFSTKKS